MTLSKFIDSSFPTMQCSHMCQGWMFSLHTFGGLSQTVRIITIMSSIPISALMIPANIVILSPKPHPINPQSMF